MYYPTLLYGPMLLVILINVPPYSVISHSSVIWNSGVGIGPEFGHHFYVGLIAYSCHTFNASFTGPVFCLLLEVRSGCALPITGNYFSNLACDWLSIVWAYSEQQETENGPWYLLKREALPDKLLVPPLVQLFCAHYIISIKAICAPLLNLIRAWTQTFNKCLCGYWLPGKTSRFPVCLTDFVRKI